MKTISFLKSTLPTQLLVSTISFTSISFHNHFYLHIETIGPRPQIPPADKEVIQLNEDIEESPDSEPLEYNECLFCPIRSSDCDKHLQHMYLSHGFFIPFIDYIKDMEGLLQLLASLVGEYSTCIYCVNRSFISVEATQHHMRDKTHCKLNFDNTDSFCDQFGDFYDFSTSYPDHELNEDQLLPPTPKLILSDDMSLVLPSGARIGHRAFKNIYKQHLTPSVSRCLVLARPTALNPAEYAMKLKLMRERKQFVGNCSKQHMKLGIKANKFRPFVKKLC